MKTSRLVTCLMAMFLIVGMATPLALASSEAGTGQDRVVTFNDPYIYTNTTVTVPSILNNETANSFTFVVVDESSSSVNYTFNMTINGTNLGTVDIISVSDDNATGYINYTADAIPILADANVTITMLYTDNYTQADVWYGTVDVVDADTYSISVTTVDLLMQVLAVGLVLLSVVKVLGSVKMDEKGKGKKKK